MADFLDNQDEQGVPPLPGGYVAVKKESQGTPPLPSGYVVKKKESSESTSQKSAGESPTKTTQKSTSSDTEPPTRAQASVALGGPTKLFGQEEEKRPTSIMYGNEPKKEEFVPPSTPIDIDQSIKYLEKTKSNPKELKRLKEKKAKMPTQKPIEYYLNKQIVSNLTPAIDQANTITEEDKSERDSSFETDWNKTGFVNKLKQLGSDILGTSVNLFNKLGLVDESMTKEDIAIEPLKKYKDQVIKYATENKIKLSPEQFKSKVQEMYNDDWDTDKKAYNLQQLNYTLNDEEQKAIGEDTFNKYKDLNTSQKYFLNTSSTLSKVRDNIGLDLVNLDKQLSEKIKNGETPTETEIKSYNDLTEKYKQYHLDAQNAYGKYAKNLDKVHSLETELDVFDNENLRSLEFLKRLGIATEQLGVGAIDFTSYLANLYSKSSPLTPGREVSMYLHQKANDLRGAIEEQNKGLRDTSNRFESVLSKSVDFITENTPMVLGLVYGGAPAMYGLAGTTAGEKYGEMLNENKDYNEFQEVVAPLLHGGAMLIPLSKQLKTIQNSGRVLLAGEKEFPKIIENVYKEKAANLFGKIKTFAGESFDLGNQLKLMTVLQEVNNSVVLGKDVDYKKLLDLEVYATAPLLHGMNKVAPYLAGKVTEPFISKEDYSIIDENTRQIFDLNKKLESGELDINEADIVKQTIKDISAKSAEVVNNKLDRIGKYSKETVDNILDATKQASDLREKANRIISSENIDAKQKEVLVKNLRGEYNSIEQTKAELISGNAKNIIYVKKETDIPIEADRVKGAQYKVVENSIEKKLFEKQQMSVNAPAVEVKAEEITTTEVAPTEAKAEEVKPAEAKAEEVKPTEVKDLSKEYIESIEKVKSEDPEKFWSVDRPFQNEDGTINEAELNKAAEEGRLIKTEAGFGVVGDDGDIKGVFKSDAKSTEKTGDKVVQEAVKAGGIKLDNFALPNLMKIYERNGFREVSRLPFNKDVAPEGWTEAQGTPDVVAMVYDPEGKLDIEKKSFTDYNEAMKYRDSYVDEAKKLQEVKPIEVKPKIKSKLEAFKAKHIDRQVFDRAKLNTQVENAKKSIAKILPNVKFVIHDTRESFIKEAGKNAPGYYDTKTSTIHINALDANSRTVYHEVFHPLLIERLKTDSNVRDLTNKMLSALSRTMDANPELKKTLDDFISRYDENLRSEEKVTELFGHLADGYEGFDAPTKSLIKKFIDRIATMFGLKPFTEGDVVDMLNTLAGKVSTGEEIFGKDVKIIKEQKTIKDAVNKFQSDFIDPKSKIEFVYDKNKDKFKKLESEGYITRDKSIKEFDGQTIFLHQPDAAFSGEIYKNGEPLVEGKGGVYYPIKFHEDGYFWASTESTANKMAKDLNAAREANGGKLLMALTSAPSDKLLSSTTAANGVMDIFLSKAFDKNFSLNKEQVKISLIDAANKVVVIEGKKIGLGLKLKKGSTLEEVKSEIQNKLNPDNSSFADRKTFVKSLISNVADIVKQNPKAVDQFGKFFSEGIKNESFKGVTKTGKLSISATNMTQGISEMLTEPMLKEVVDRNKGGQVYAILELNGDVKPIDSNKHESYPKAIQSVDPNNKVKLHILTDRVQWSDVFEDPKTGDIVTKERQLNIFPTSGVSTEGLKLNTKKGKFQEPESYSDMKDIIKDMMDDGKSIEEIKNIIGTELGKDQLSLAERAYNEFKKEPITEEPKKENIVKRTVKSFFENDIAPMFKSTAEAVTETTKAVVNALSPKTGVGKEAVTKFYELVGDRNKSITLIDKQIGEYKKTFDKMPDAERIDFIDRMKAGKPQDTPELDAIAKVISKLDKDLYDEITKYNPNLAWKENHFRVLWKKAPGTEKEKYWSFLSKRPVRGSRGFFGQSTLRSMSEGIEKGGVPYSTNPIEMFEMSYNDGMKYVTAQRIIDSFKKDGIIKFVKSGQDVPDGYTKINDSVANVYFKTDQGMVKTGEYWIQEDPGRMLNNMLSRDYIRDTKLGTSLMGIKNFYTAIELGLSPFHAVAISLEQIASGAGIGLRKIINLGDVKGGIKDVLTAPFSPKTTFSLGRKYFKFATAKEFENSPEGKSFLQKNPRAKEYLDDFFQGGGLVKQHDDLKNNAYKALKENMGKDNYIGAGLRALPALNEGVMDPLFNVYIPSLKIGLFMKEFPLILAENKSRLDSGKVTREELSRKTIDGIDNRLGEMNFDNLYWNKTFKTSMQFMLRSVTWKLGNIRQMGGAAPEQAIEFVNAIKENRRPNLSPKMAWLFGLSLTQVVLASVIQHMSLDDDDKDKEIKDFKDIVAPRINSADNKERVVIPTYYKDLLHFWHAPTEYVSSGVSGPFGKGVELYNNEDFYKYNIYDETDPVYKQLIDAGKYAAPKPFSITSFQKMREKGEPVSKQALSFMGFNKAPGYLEHSDLESEILDLYSIRNTSVKPLKMKEANDKKKEIREMYKKDISKAQEMANEAVKEGLLKPTQVTRLFRDVAKNEDAMVFFFKRLPESDKEYLATKMTEEEKKKFNIKKKLTDAEFKEKYGEKAFKQLLRARELSKKGAK